MSESLLMQAVAAKKFFITKTLRRDWQIQPIALIMRPNRLPVVLTLQEVARLLVAIRVRLQTANSRRSGGLKLFIVNHTGPFVGKLKAF